MSKIDHRLSDHLYILERFIERLFTISIQSFRQLKRCFIRRVIDVMEVNLECGTAAVLLWTLTQPVVWSHTPREVTKCDSVELRLSGMCCLPTVAPPLTTLDRMLLVRVAPSLSVGIRAAYLRLLHIIVFTSCSVVKLWADRGHCVSTNAPVCVEEAHGAGSGVCVCGVKVAINNIYIYILLLQCCWVTRQCETIKKKPMERWIRTEQ